MAVSGQQLLDALHAEAALWMRGMVQGPTDPTSQLCIVTRGWRHEVKASPTTCSFHFPSAWTAEQMAELVMCTIMTKKETNGCTLHLCGLNLMCVLPPVTPDSYKSVAQLSCVDSPEWFVDVGYGFCIQYWVVPTYMIDLYDKAMKDGLHPVNPTPPSPQDDRWEGMEEVVGAVL